MKAVVILGSVREGRLCERVGRYVETELTKRNFSVSVLDPKVEKFPLLEKPFHFYKPEEEVPAFLAEWAAKLQQADAIVVVSGEYNHSIPPALANVLDYFYSGQYGFKPSGIVTYSAGSFAGIRAGAALRNLLGEIGTPSIPFMLSFGGAQNTINPEGQLIDQTIQSRTDRFITQLEWWASAAKKQREEGIPKL